MGGRRYFVPTELDEGSFQIKSVKSFYLLFTDLSKQRAESRYSHHHQQQHHYSGLD